MSRMRRRNALRSHRFNGLLLCLTLALVAVLRFAIDFEHSPPKDHAHAAALQAVVGSRTPIDLVLILDESGSVASEVQQVATESKLFIDNLHLECNSHINVAVVVFSTNAQTRVGLTSDPQRLKSGIRLASTGGGTDIGAGMREARRELAKGRPSARKAVILVSDGENNSGCSDAAREARNLGTSVRRYALCVSQFCIASCMVNELASEQQYGFRAESRGRLRAAFQSIASDYGTTGSIVTGDVIAYGKHQPWTQVFALGANGYEFVATDGSGRFEMLRLLPGSYTLYAFVHSTGKSLTRNIVVVKGCNDFDLILEGQPDVSYVWPLPKSNRKIGSFFDHQYPVANWSGPISDIPSMMLYTGREPQDGEQYTGHEGLDISASVGTSVFAAAAGTVHDCSSADSKKGFGICIELHHEDGNLTRYAHLTSKEVIAQTDGNQVRQSDKIGTSGQTGKAYGAHLHFEIAPVDRRWYRFDPFGWRRPRHEDPWVIAGGPPSRYIFAGGQAPILLSTSDTAGRLTHRSSVALQQTSLDPLVNAEYFVVPDQQSVYTSDDASVVVTVITNTFSSPVRMSLFRVFHGDRRATDNPNPVPPPTLETFASLLVGVFDPVTDTDIEPEKPISVELIAEVESDRPADFSTLRVVLEQADGLVPTNADIVRDSVTGRTTIQMEVTSTGRYLLVADALAISATASPTVATSAGPATGVDPLSSDTVMRVDEFDLMPPIVLASSLIILALLRTIYVRRRTSSPPTNVNSEEASSTDADDVVRQ